MTLADIFIAHPDLQGITVYWKSKSERGELVVRLKEDGDVEFKSKRGDQEYWTTTPVKAFSYSKIISFNYVRKVTRSYIEAWLI